MNGNMIEKANEFDAILAGASKCGTTSLIFYLYQHPEIFVPWDDESDKDLKFDTMPKDLRIPNNKFNIIRDESLLYNRKRIKKLYKSNPHIKLIFSFRDPVERAKSAYWYKNKNRGLHISFEESLNHPRWGDWVLKEGLYKRGVKNFTNFLDDNKFFIIAEEMWNNKNSVFEDLFHFLEVDSKYRPEKLPKRNPGGAPRIRFIHDIVTNNYHIPILSTRYPEIFPILRKGVNIFNLGDYPEMDRRIREKLVKYYREKNKGLDKIIEKDLSKWWDWWNKYD